MEINPIVEIFLIIDERESREVLPARKDSAVLILVSFTFSIMREARIDTPGHGGLRTHIVPSLVVAEAILLGCISITMLNEFA